MSASSSSVVLWAAGVVAVGLVWRAANKARRAVIPRRDQIVALFERAPADGTKIHMLNLSACRPLSILQHLLSPLSDRALWKASRCAMPCLTLLRASLARSQIQTAGCV